VALFIEVSVFLHIGLPPLGYNHAVWFAYLQQRTQFWWDEHSLGENPHAIDFV